MQVDSRSELVDLLVSSSHQFRIFKRDGERRAFRLETAFWDVLERAAKQQGRRIGDLVFDIIRRSETSNNLSSVLRSYALMWLDDQLRSNDDRIVLTSAVAVLNASPSAGLILDEKHYILAYNKAIIDFIQQRVGPRIPEIKEVRLSFDVSIPKILEIVGNHAEKVVECGFRLVSMGVPVSGRARVSSLATLIHTRRRLLVFII